MTNTLWPILVAILYTSCQAAVVALLIVGLQLSLGRRLSPNWRIALWSLVIIRLITPTLPASPFSMLNLLHPASLNPLPTTIDPQPTITFGIISDTPTLPSHPAPALPTPTSHTPDWRLIPLALWAFVSSVLLMQLAISQTILLHRLRSSRIVDDLRMIKLLEDCRQTLRAPPIRCVEADWISTPALCGLFHHTLLLPPNFSDTLSGSDLQFILMHELIHARRHDLLMDRLIAIIVTFHWFNPAAWLALRRIRTERELACDQTVLQSTTPAARLDYGQTLLNIAERLTTRPNALMSIGVADRRCSMRRRLLAIVHPPRQWKLQSPIAALCIAIVAFTTFTSAETNPTTNTSPNTSLRPTTTPSGMVLRSYDVAPLFVYVPSDDPAIDFNQKNVPHDSAHMRITRPTTQQLAQQLIADIQSRIDPPSWKSASISESDGKLLVTQTPSNQDAIWQYVSSLLADHATQVTIETRILSLSPTAVARWKSRHPSKPLTGDLFVTKADQDELIKLTQIDQLATTITAPRLTLFNHERGYCIVGTSTAYIRDLHPSSTTHPSPSGFEPDIGHADSGVSVDVRAITSADRQYITLELNIQLSDLLSMKRAPWPKAPHGRTDLMVQIPTERHENLNASVSLPNDGYFITPAVETIQPPGAVPASDAPTLVIIHAKIIKDDSSQAMPSTTRPSN